LSLNLHGGKGSDLTNALAGKLQHGIGRRISTMIGIKL
jgi:hypothetical protein